MRQDRTAVPAAKENPATAVTVTGSKTTNSHEGISMYPRIPVRFQPAYGQRGNDFARLTQRTMPTIIRGGAR